jgi:hypothetical protein
LQSPKARKGTKFWTADPSMTSDLRAGQQPLDAHCAVAPERWAEEASQTLTPLLTAAAQGIRSSALAALDPAGTEQKSLAPELAALVLAVVGMASEAIRNRLAQLADRLGRDQEQADSIDQLTDAVTAHHDGSSAFTTELATNVAHALTEGAAQATAATLPGIEHTWQTRGDEKVRESHPQLNGVTLPVKEPFEVDGAVLHYPGDPLAPPSQTVNCRCRLVYRSTAPALEAKRAQARRSEPFLDARGRHVEVGGVARLGAVGAVQVIGELTGRRVRVERLDTHQRATVPATRLTMLARPNRRTPRTDPPVASPSRQPAR